MGFMRVSVRRVRFVLALMTALMLVSSLSIVLSGAAAATTGQRTTGDHQDEDCTNLDVQSVGGDHQDCEPDLCPDLAAQTGGGDHDDCDSEGCSGLAALNGGGDHQDDEDCDSEECPELAAVNGGGDGSKDCEPDDGDECPDLAVQTSGGDHQDDDDCDSEECPQLAAVSGGGDGSKDCEPDDGEECPDLAVQTSGGDHQDDDDCDSEECPDLAAPNDGGDHQDDEDCTPTTSTTTTTTTLPAIRPQPLELSAIGAECISDIPYLSYEIDYPPGQSATITFINPTGPDVVYEDVPLNGAVLWPGASMEPPDWPGWIRKDGVWVEADDGFLWARGTVSVLFEVNPSTVVTVSYEQGTGSCADPNPDVVGGVVITPPTVPAQIGGVEVLPFTGFPVGELAAVAFSAMALGGLMVLGAKRDEAEES
jgi:hypothetical protein